MGNEKSTIEIPPTFFNDFWANGSWDMKRVTGDDIDLVLPYAHRRPIVDSNRFEQKNATLVCADFEFRKFSWEINILIIRTEKFVLTISLDNGYEGVSEPIRDIHPQIQSVAISKKAWDSRKVELEFINGGTEEDYILYMLERA